MKSITTEHLNPGNGLDEYDEYKYCCLRKITLFFSLMLTDKALVYAPGIPEPTSRAELLKCMKSEGLLTFLYSRVCFYKLRPPIFPVDWLKLSLDDKTANKMLWISDSGSKVCRRTEEVCPVLDRPERYEYSPQVSLIFFFFFNVN